MKYIVLILFTLYFFSFSYFVLGWSYPLREVTKPEVKCKYKLWSQTSSNCRISLPELKASEYKKYIGNIFYRKIYTVLWLSSYKGGWDVKNGTHLGTDIATNVGTPVYSIGQGRVVFAGKKKGWGKVVVIEHKVNGTKVYSNYAHLSKVTVEKGQVVNENTKVGEVGNTGNSWGSHLHFQIDRSNSWIHPFWFRNCKGNIKNIVNSTSCLSQAYNSTLDPLEFLETNGAIVKASIKEIIKRKPKIDRKKIITLESIKEREIKEFVKNIKFKISFLNGGVYNVGKESYFKVYLTDKRGRKYKRIFPDDIIISYDKKYIKYVLPAGMKVVDKERKIRFKPIKEGITFITIKIGKHILASKSLRIIKKGQRFEVKSGRIITFPRKKYISYPAWGINIFQDKNYVNLIRVPFKGKYKITSNSDIYFCKAPNNLRKLNHFNCDRYNSEKQLFFSYKDTLASLFLFKFYSISGKKAKLIVENVDGKKIFETANLYFSNFKLTKNSTNYKSDLISACKKGLCLNLLNKGYLTNDREISLDKAKYLLQNFMFLFGKKIKSGISYSDRYKMITRGDFVKFLYRLIGGKQQVYHKLRYIDVKKGDELYYAVSFLSKLGFKWKDRFSNYHFQPDKNITYEESIYLVNFVISKYKK